MKPVRLMFVMACAAFPAAAQEPVLIDHNFHFNLTRFQLAQDPASTTTLANYNVTLQAPVMSYRLGALALMGSVDYQRSGDGDRSRSAFGLNRYGLKANLFPYRPFHLTVEYTHSESPDLEGSARVKGDTYGAGFRYNGRAIEDIQLSFRRGTYSQNGVREGWSIWTMGGSQHFSTTRLTYQANRQEFQDSVGGVPWHGTSLFASTETPLPKDWEFRTSFSADEYAGSRSLSLSADLHGQIHAVATLSNLSTSMMSSGESRSRNTNLSQSFMLPKERFTAYSSLVASFTTSTATEEVKRGVLVAGGSYSLGDGWRSSADVSVSSNTDATSANAKGLGQGAASTARNLQTFHAGISHGGDLPAVLKHTLFFLSDVGFERRVREDYPPGFVPSELAQELVQRRLRQNGGLGFAVDLSRSQAAGSGATQDWARVSGDLRVNTGFRFAAIGDWKRDNRFANPGFLQDQRALLLNASYLIGSASNLNANVSYADSTQHLAPGTNPETAGSPLELGALSRKSLSTSLGFNGRFWRMPYGVLWMRSETGTGRPSTDLALYATLDFRQISLRVNYEVIRRTDGLRSTRITVDLLRWFDTIALGGSGLRW